MAQQTITIRDLARLASVSIATVSRALAGSPQVKDATRARILALAREHHFEPSAVARSLSSSRSTIIGVLIDDIANPFFVQVVKGIERGLESTGYSLTVASSNWDAGKEEDLVRTMIRNRVAGLIVAPTADNAAALEILRQSCLPFVVVNARGAPGDAFICTDNFHGGYLAGSHLIARGVKRIALLVGFPHPSADNRLAGFQAAVRDSGRTDLELVTCRDVRTFEEGYERAAALIAKHRLDLPASGVFALNDVVAAGFLKAAVELNIPIPGHLALIGFDDIFFAELFRFPLTTVQQPKEEMGGLAVQSLLERIADPQQPPATTVLAPRLIVRTT